MEATISKSRQYCRYAEVYEETNSIGVVGSKSNCDIRREDNKRLQQIWRSVLNTACWYGMLVHR